MDSDNQQLWRPDLRIVFLLILGKFRRLFFSFFHKQKSNTGLFYSACRCSCGLCKTEALVGERECRCCKKLGSAQRVMVFDGNIECFRCIKEQEDYTALTSKAVLSLVGPLLRCTILPAFR